MTIKKNKKNKSKHQVETLPVVEEDLLIMIGCFYEAKIILQCCYVSQKPLGANSTIKDLEGHSTLLSGAFHLTDGEFHLVEARRFTFDQKLHLLLLILITSHFKKLKIFFIFF